MPVSHKNEEEGGWQTDSVDHKRKDGGWLQGILDTPGHVALDARVCIKDPHAIFVLGAVKHTNGAPHQVQVQEVQCNDAKTKIAIKLCLKIGPPQCFFQSPAASSGHGPGGASPPAIVWFYESFPPNNSDISQDVQCSKEGDSCQKGQRNGLHDIELEFEAPATDGALGCQELLIERRHGCNVEHLRECKWPCESEGREYGHHLKEVHPNAKSAQVHTLPPSKS